MHAAVNEENAGKGPAAIALVEIHREDLASLPVLLKMLRESPRRCLLFCDDLSFDSSDTSYKSLKAVLEGGIEGRPHNVVFYATSNRRHLMPREMIENERSTAINPSEAVEEKVSLSDRFGLWLGFHHCDQDTYFAIIEGYARHYGLTVPLEDLARRGQRMVGDARRPLGPRRLAVHPGPGRPAGPAPGLTSRKLGYEPRYLRGSTGSVPSADLEVQLGRGDIARSCRSARSV